jgi:hypothetical protein
VTIESSITTEAGSPFCFFLILPLLLLLLGAGCTIASACDMFLMALVSETTLFDDS